MNFFYSVINLVGFLFYIAAGFAAIRALCTYDYFFNKKEGKSTSFVLSILILSPILGYCIRDFAQHQKELLQFKEIVKQEFMADFRIFQKKIKKNKFKSFLKSSMIHPSMVNVHS